MDVVDCGAASPRFMGGLDGVGWVASALPPLWIADQVRNDVTVLVVLACFTRVTLPLWIADQVRNDVTMLESR